MKVPYEHLIRPRANITFLILNSIKHDEEQAHKCLNDILALISIINTTSESKRSLYF